MCFFGSSQRTAPPKPEFKDSPPVVTGMQTGVKNPKDTGKATEQLKIKRQKKEGTYVDPNLSVLEDSLTTGSKMSRSDRARKTANQDRAKHNFNKRKFKTSPTGRKTGVA